MNKTKPIIEWRNGGYIDFATVEDQKKCMAWVNTLLLDQKKKVLKVLGEKEEMGNDLDFNDAYPKQIRNQLRDELILKVKKLK